MWSMLFLSTNNVRNTNKNKIDMKNWQKEDLNLMYKYYFDPEYIKLREDIKKNCQDCVGIYR